MLALILIVLLLWGAIDWFRAASQISVLWIIAPFAFMAIVYGTIPLIEPAFNAVVDRALPRYGELVWYPWAVVVAGIGMVASSWTFWKSLGGRVWSRIH